MICSASRRSSSVRTSWRSSATSWSGIRVFAQCTMPMPMPSIAKAVPMPSSRFCKRSVEIAVDSAQRDGKVRDEEKQGTNHGNCEENRNLSFGALFGPGILIGQARAVREEVQDSGTSPLRPDQP